MSPQGVAICSSLRMCLKEMVAFGQANVSVSPPLFAASADVLSLIDCKVSEQDWLALVKVGEGCISRVVAEWQEDGLGLVKVAQGITNAVSPIVLSHLFE